MRYAVAVIVLVVVVLVWWTGSNALFLLVFGWPVLLGGLIGALTKMRPGKAVLAGGCIGLFPGALLALGNLLSGHRSSSADMTNEGAFLLILIVLAVPNALAGAAGGFLGVLLRKPAMVVPE